MNPYRKRLLCWFRDGTDKGTKLLRWKLTQPGFNRLMLSFDGADPLREWKAWERRVSAHLGRAPGNWRTRRGIKKRQKALLSVYSL